jgi:hypothetical protein
MSRPAAGRGGRTTRERNGASSFRHLLGDWYDSLLIASHGDAAIKREREEL